MEQTVIQSLIRTGLETCATKNRSDGEAVVDQIESDIPMIQELLNQKVVIDLKSEYVAFGTLKRIDDHFLELKAADLHDLRDSDSTRELYVADTALTGIKRNRRSVLINRAEIVAIALFEDIATE